MTKKQTLGHRIKSAILGWATGRILPRVMLAATAAYAAAALLLVLWATAMSQPGSATSGKGATWTRHFAGRTIKMTHRVPQPRNYHGKYDR